MRSAHLLTALSLAAGAWGQTPESDPRAALVRMGEAVEAVLSYRAEVHRITEMQVSEETERTETIAVFAIERPNRVLLDGEHPEGRLRVVSDGERLTVWSQREGLTLDMAAPATLAEVDECTSGLAAEGLALAGLFLADQPVDRLVEGFDTIHDIGTAMLDGRECRLVGLERIAGLRMIIWIDQNSWLPCQVTLDATAALLDLLAAQNVNDRGARVTVTERHDRVEVAPAELTFDTGPPREERSGAPRE